MAMLSHLSAGKRWFELTAQLIVLYSVVVFYIESEINEPGASHAAAGFWLWNERVLVALFSTEYVFRWAQAKDRFRYPWTPLAIVDLLAIGPAFVGVSLNLRSLKLLRILPLLWFFKLYGYNQALQNVILGFRKVRHELAVVGFTALVVVLSSSMALHEFERHAQPEKFGRLSDALWWSIVTLTTVGYGDSYPITGAGRFIAVVTMLLGIGILGTFISLVGGSFLTTMRAGDGPDERVPTVPMPKDGPAAAPWTGRRAG
jgi:voltage-gated potassium channel